MAAADDEVVSRKRIIEFFRESDHHLTTAEIYDHVKENKKKLNLVLWRLQRQNVIESVQHKPRTWRLTLPFQQGLVALKSQTRRWAHCVKQKKGLVLPNQEKKYSKAVLTLFQSLNEPLRSVEVARAVGLQTAADINPILKTLQRKKLIEKINQVPPTWFITPAVASLQVESPTIYSHSDRVSELKFPGPDQDYKSVNMESSDPFCESEKVTNSACSEWDYSEGGDKSAMRGTTSAGPSDEAVGKGCSCEQIGSSLSQTGADLNITEYHIVSKNQNILSQDDYEIKPQGLTSLNLSSKYQSSTIATSQQDIPMELSHHYSNSRGGSADDTHEHIIPKTIYFQAHDNDTFREKDEHVSSKQETLVPSTASSFSGSLNFPLLESGQFGEQSLVPNDSDDETDMNRLQPGFRTRVPSSTPNKLSWNILRTMKRFQGNDISRRMKTADIVREVRKLTGGMRGTGKVTKKDVNRCLYNMEKQDLVKKVVNQPPEWQLTAAGRQAVAETDIGTFGAGFIQHRVQSGAISHMQSTTLPAHRHLQTSSMVPDSSERLPKRRRISESASSKVGSGSYTAPGISRNTELSSTDRPKAPKGRGVHMEFLRSLTISKPGEQPLSKRDPRPVQSEPFRIPQSPAELLRSDPVFQEQSYNRSIPANPFIHAETDTKTGFTFSKLEANVGPKAQNEDCQKPNIQHSRDSMAGVTTTVKGTVQIGHGQGNFKSEGFQIPKPPAEMIQKDTFAYADPGAKLLSALQRPAKVFELLQPANYSAWKPPSQLQSTSNAFHCQQVMTPASMTFTMPTGKTSMVPLGGPHMGDAMAGLNSEAFAALNKNPVSALMEYAQSRKTEARIEVIGTSGPSHNPRFKISAFVGKRQFPCVVAKNKKDGRKDAADLALRTLMSEGQYQITSSKSPMELLAQTGQKPTHFDRMAALAHQAFNTLAATIPEGMSGRKVLAAMIMKTAEDEGTVISLGTGNRCITGQQLSLEGHTVNDSHAEIITRRGFIRFLYRNLLQHDPGTGDSLFVSVSRDKVKVKDGITFHLYISTAPCGDGALFSVRDNNSKPVPTDETASVAHHPTMNSKLQGLLRTKMEGGEGTIPIEPEFSGQTWDGILRGERLRTMSCSDKLCRWNILGMQGALLGHFMEPIYMSSLTLGYLFDEGHLSRAVCCRLVHGEPDISQSLPEGYRVNHPQLGRVTIYDPPRETEKTKSLSVNWCLGDQFAEVLDGTKGQCVPRVGANAISQVSKSQMFLNFKQLCEKWKRDDLLQGSSTYAQAKALCAQFQTVKQLMVQKFKASGFGPWMKKPVEEEMFS